MSEVYDLHRKAMSLLDESHLARTVGDTMLADSMRRQAYETEQQAAILLQDRQLKSCATCILKLIATAMKRYEKNAPLRRIFTEAISTVMEAIVCSLCFERRQRQRISLNCPPANQFAWVF
jgi:hypothetical protein